MRKVKDLWNNCKRERERQRETERHRERQRERQTQRDRRRERQTDRDREILEVKFGEVFNFDGVRPKEK